MAEPSAKKAKTGEKLLSSVMVTLNCPGMETGDATTPTQPLYKLCEAAEMPVGDMTVDDWEEAMKMYRSDEYMVGLFDTLTRRKKVKDWAAQIELGKGGLVHIQGCMKTNRDTRIRISSVLNGTQWGGCAMWDHIKLSGDIRPCMGGWEDAKDYCNKDENKDGSKARFENHEAKNMEEHGTRSHKLTDRQKYFQWCKDGEHGLNLWPWQTEFLGMVEEWMGMQGNSYEKIIARNNCAAFNREVCAIVDKNGKSGKSLMVDWLCGFYGKKVFGLPMLKSGEDVCAFTCSNFIGKGSEGGSGTIIKDGPVLVLIDLPRGVTGGGIGKRAACEYMSGIECIKDGKCYDKRYQGRILKWVSKPVVVVFANSWPKMLTSESALTPDRVNVKYIWSDKTLQDHEEPGVGEDQPNAQENLAGGDQVGGYPGGGDGND